MRTVLWRGCTVACAAVLALATACGSGSSAGSPSAGGDDVTGGDSTAPPDTGPVNDTGSPADSEAHDDTGLPTDAETPDGTEPTDTVTPPDTVTNDLESPPDTADGADAADTGGPGLENALVLAPGARACEVVVHDPDGRVTEITFGDGVLGRSIRQGDRIAITILRLADADFGADALTVSISGAGATGLTLSRGACFDRIGSLIPSGAPTFEAAP